MADKDIRIKPLALGASKDLAERVAACIPGSGVEPFKSDLEILKRILIKSGGWNEVGYEEVLRRQGNFIVWKNTALGHLEVIFTDNEQRVIDYLKSIENKLGREDLGSNYTLQLSDGKQLCKTSILEWFDSNNI